MYIVKILLFINIIQNLFPPGTIPYIPPEYYDTGKYHAKPTTVFSLGVLLFKIVHGCYPTAQDHYDLANNDWSRFVVSRG